MKISEISIEDDIYQAVVELRYELFFKAHALPKSILYDEFENESTHVVMTNEAGLVAYGRLSALGSNEFTISQMVVDPLYQNKGIGSQVLTRILRIASAKKATKISLEARIHAIPMYEKQGFVKSGEVFDSPSTGVPHCRMEVNGST